MQQQQVRRIPMPKAEEIAALPDMAQDILAQARDGLDDSAYKGLAREFVDAVNGKKPKIGRGALRYNNPELLQSATVFSGVGEYNPDKIPIHIYEKMRLDPQIALATSFIELQILAQNYRMECSDPQIAAFCREAIRPIYRDTVRMMLRSEQFGFAVGEKIYAQKHIKIVETSESGGKKTLYNDVGVVVDRVKFIHPKTVKIIRDRRTEELRGVKQDAGVFPATTRVMLRPVKIEKCIWFSPSAIYGNFFGTARYKSAYQPWYWYQILVQFMLRYMERRGSPTAIGRAPMGSSVTDGNEKLDNMEYMLRCTEAAAGNSAVVIPSAFDRNSNKQLWELEFKHDDQRGEMFTDVLRFLNTLKLRALLVPDKVGVAEGSSTNATAESHLDVHMLSEEGLIQMIEDTLNKSLISDYVRFNFPPEKQVPCFIKIERLNFGKRQLLKDIFIRMLMLAGGTIREGTPPNWIPSLKKMAELLEVPGDEFDKIFLPGMNVGGNSAKNVDTTNPDNNGNSSGDDDMERDDKVKSNNADKTPRRDRTRRERRSQERI